MSRPSIVTIVGESGVGKTTLMRSLLDRNSIFRILPSVTTRTTPGTDIPGEYRYLFPSDYKDFANQQGRFLWDVETEDPGKRYAKDSLDIADALEDPDHVYLNALVPRCARSLVIRFGHEAVRTVFLESPGSKELRARMIARGDDNKSMRARMQAEQDWPREVADIEGLVVITSQDLVARCAVIEEIAGVAAQ